MHSFDVISLSPITHCDDGNFFNVKPSSKNDYRIGLITKKSVDDRGLPWYEADIYNIVERVKEIDIEVVTGPNLAQCVTQVTAVMAGGERYTLNKEKTKIYRESVRLALPWRGGIFLLFQKCNFSFVFFFSGGSRYKETNDKATNNYHIKVQGNIGSVGGHGNEVTIKNTSD